MAQDAGYTYVPVNPAWDMVIDNLSVIPVVALCLGPTVGLGAGRLVMSHLAVMVQNLGQLFTAGPPVVHSGTGEDLTKAELGGADVHRRNGTAGWPPGRITDDYPARGKRKGSFAIMKPGLGRGRSAGDRPGSAG